MLMSEEANGSFTEPKMINVRRHRVLRWKEAQVRHEFVRVLVARPRVVRASPGYPLSMMTAGVLVRRPSKGEARVREDLMEEEETRKTRS